MTPPLLLVVSPDADFSADLTSRLNGAFHVLSFPTPEEAQIATRQQPLWGLVADFRDCSRGGHLEERFLNDFQTRIPKGDGAVLTPADCPEPVERLMACSEFAWLRGRFDIEQLADSLRKKAAGATSPTQSSEPVFEVPSETESDTVLTGITRRFETNTPKLKLMLADLEIAAKHDVTVLLIGETGSGKTFLSKLVHEISPRRNQPFLPVACGALPSDLIESELFGHMKGSFTSAHADKDGKFIAARRGTILLDEIDVLGPEQQVKLLRVIETGEFEPVGSNKTLKCEARLVVASNLELQPLVEQGKFRPDLYYRLNMLKFDIPPLRARKPDIIPLARKFIREQSAKHNIQVHRIDDSLYAALYRYPWPGNVRELENVIQRAVIYCREGVLSAQHLPPHVVMCQAGPSNDGTTQQFTQNEFSDARTRLGQRIAVSEREIIEEALFKNNYSRTNTAKSLGISRVTLYNKMKKYGMSK
ncbi:MAG: sigma-54-dependent Fis family transcriptional regulator [Planctomycetales bacterium]|nr:sigma-54-dependent Fis family transcriptional regulator [Planctomycetales bacterium]